MHRLEGRTLEILKIIVAEYIATGEPVGSRTISKRKEVGLSAASIRNIMSDLAESGYIIQPHVSAGRIPTDTGYRYYVDCVLQNLLQERGTDRSTIESLIRPAGTDVRDVLRQCSYVLAELSRKTGVVTATVPSEQQFRTIDFIKVADDRILVVLVSAGGLVQNKMIVDEDALDQETLERYSRMLNDLLNDLDLRQARLKIEQELTKEKTLMNAALSKILGMGHIILSQEGQREVYIQGETNMLDEPEFSNVEQLRAVLVTFQEKSKLLRILDKTLEAEGIQILIGSEHGVDEIGACAIIAYPIRTTNSVLASISVIGPKRMNYHQLIPLVISTGKVVTTLVKESCESPD